MARAQFWSGIFGNPQQAGFAGEWVLGSDMAGTGTTAANQPIAIPAPWGSADEMSDIPLIELRFTAQLLNATGVLRVQPMLQNLKEPIGAITASTWQDGQAYYAGMIHCTNAAPVERRMIIKPQIWVPFSDPNGYADREYARLVFYAVGTVVGTSWSVTNIKARLVWLPK